MKKRVLFLVVLLILPIIYAKIDISNPTYSDYNLGEKISVSSTIIKESSFNGFFKFILRCNNYTLNYYTIPIELNPGEEKIIAIDNLKLAPSMIGSCYIDAELQDDLSKLIERSSSQTFTISNKLNILAKTDKLDLLPGDKLTVTGNVKNIRNEDLKDGIVKIDLEKELVLDLKTGKFGSELEIAKDIKSGQHDIVISTNDNNGNLGIDKITINVIPVPTELKNSVNALTFKPESSLSISPLLYDQASEPLIVDAEISIYDAKNKQVFSQKTKTNSTVQYDFPKHALPGDWSIKTSSSNLNIESKITVEAIELIDIKNDGSAIVITNLGNVIYEKPVTINANDHIFSKETALNPGELGVIDLSKEDLPTGSYNIKVNSGDSEKTFENLEITHVSKTVTEFIEAVAPMTGKAIGTADDWYINPYIISIIVIVIIIILILYFYFRKKSKHKQEIVKTRGLKEAEEFVKKVKTKPQSSFRKPSDLFRAKPLKEDEIKEFRERLLKDYNKEKEQHEIEEKRSMILQKQYEEEQELKRREQVKSSYYDKYKSKFDMEPSDDKEEIIYVGKKSKETKKPDDENNKDLFNMFNS